MQNPVEPEPIDGPAPGSALWQSFAAIDHDNPLELPWRFNPHHIGPRLDRLDAKTAYLADYIAYLEQRIECLEARLDEGSSR